jgi:maltooligosyltrehalose trehalohydrolase
MESSPQRQVEEVPLGATPLSGGRWRFLVWAPNLEKVDVHATGSAEQVLSLRAQGCGYHGGVFERLEPGQLYYYRLPDGRELPDPASRFQPLGVHGPSALVDVASFRWTDRQWSGLPLDEYVIYELHVGTYTPEGTFDSVIPHLAELRELGVTAIEIMPVAQFPGNRNWGYDGVFPFAVQESYGGPAGLQRLVDAAHSSGLAVVLDVVYNHIGPEGNYLAEYAPYFTGRYRTPWGPALNFDAAHSDEVRRFFVENAVYWLDSFHIDALRLDAIHGIVDTGAVPFLAELVAAVQTLARRSGRKIHLIAESDLNDARVVRTREAGGYGLDAQWSDDFHHALHVLLTGENTGYYADFDGIGCLATALEQGWCFSGQFSKHRQRRHGNSPRGLSRDRFVVCSQNHDQVGNRALGDRLSQIVDLEKLKLAAGAVLLSPFVPLLFMGEEYAETAPFQFFTSHSDPELIEAVRRGRREEFAAFAWITEPPDPQSESTFLRSKLNHDLIRREPHRTIRSLYRELLGFRRRHLPLENLSVSITAFESEGSLALAYQGGSGRALVLYNFGAAESVLTVECEPGVWQKAIDSADLRWHGLGSDLPYVAESKGNLVIRLKAASFAAFRREETFEE